MNGPGRDPVPRGRGLRPWVAFAVMAVSLGAVAVTLVATVALIAHGAPADIYSSFANLSLSAAFAMVGWLVATRRPANLMGWVLLAIGLSQAIEVAAATGAGWEVVMGPGAVPFAAELAWISTWAWALGLGLMSTYLLLLYPDGHLLSRRWTPVAWASGVMILMNTVPTAVLDWPNRSIALIQDSGSNPFQLVGLVLLPVLALASLASLILRYGRSTGIERLQLRWFTWAAVPVIAFVLLASSPDFPTVLWLPASVLVVPLLPAAIAMAVLRYRLYEIDRIVSRTLGWTISTGVVLAVFASGVALFEAVLSRFTQGATLAVAASTLLAFAAFQPLRRRIQRTVDRRFDRAHYDGERTAAAFADRLRVDVTLGAVAGELESAVRISLRPDGTKVWLREGVG